MMMMLPLLLQGLIVYTDGYMLIKDDSADSSSDYTDHLDADQLHERNSTWW